MTAKMSQVRPAVTANETLPSCTGNPMNDLRKTTGDDRLSLKAAVRRALALAGGGESVQHATRVDNSSLSRYGSVSEEHQKNHCPIDVALDLDLEAGRPVIVEVMARRLGCELHPISPAAHSDMPWCAKLGVLSRQAGQLHGLLGDALADNQIDAIEAKAIVEEVDRHIEHLRKLKSRVEAEGGQGGNIVPVRKTGEAR